MTNIFLTNNKNNLMIKKLKMNSKFLFINQNYLTIVLIRAVHILANKIFSRSLKRNCLSLPRDLGYSKHQ